MENIVLLILGIFIAVIGVINMSGNISTIHSYNRKRVTEEDIPKYGKAVGIGTLIIGAAFILAFIFLMLKWELPAILATVSGILVGLAFILYAQFKYNKGIF